MAIHFPRPAFIDQGKAAISHSIGRRFFRHRYLLQNKSPRQQLLQEGLFSVHYYQPITEDRIQVGAETVAVNHQRHTVPLLLVPPLGVYGWVFDLMAERSLVRYFLAQGFAVYIIDWGHPTESDSYLSLETYTLNWLPKAVQAIQQHSGQPQLSLVGYCMGGLLSLVYTAARGQDSVKNLITIASPVNMHQMNSAIGKLYQLFSVPAQLMHRVTGLELDHFASHWFHVSGKLLSIGFQLTQPTAMLSSYLDLLKNMTSRQYVSRYTTINEWFTNMPDYPGATMREMIEKFGLENRLSRGQLCIGGEHIDLTEVKAALLALAGESDAITSISAASAILSVVGSLDKTFEVVPGGHAGLFTGSQAVKTTWVIIADWLKLRSGRPSGLVQHGISAYLPVTEQQVSAEAQPGSYGS
ncbi:alpha/beta fold hydrolase [Alkanindiges sp. WGS2144]|uniref:alpha/beta fold hydrolase n=1 Tax=Alkanindiges sp. WGS2144 TaxID=3366808 RepID=UPI0037512AC2